MTVASQEPPLDGKFEDTSKKEFKLQVHFCFKLTFKFFCLKFAFMCELLSVTLRIIPFNAYILKLHKCETTQRPFEGFLLNSRGNI